MFVLVCSGFCNKTSACVVQTTEINFFSIFSGECKSKVKVWARVISPKVPLLGLQAVAFWFSHSLSSGAHFSNGVFCCFLIELSGFIRESQDYKGLESWPWGLSSCQRWAKYWQSSGYTAYTSWPSPIFFFSCLATLGFWPSISRDHGLHLYACGQLLVGCSEPPPHTGPG